MDGSFSIHFTKWATEAQTFSNWTKIAITGWKPSTLPGIFLILLILVSRSPLRVLPAANPHGSAANSILVSLEERMKPRGRSRFKAEGETEASFGAGVRLLKCLKAGMKGSKAYLEEGQADHLRDPGTPFSTGLGVFHIGKVAGFAFLLP